MASSERTVFLNGQWLPESEAKISIYDEWLNQGWGVFEMTRSFNYEPFQLRAHLERLYDGANYCKIRIPINIDGLEALCHEVQLRNQPAMQTDDEHRLMITVSPGPRQIYRHAVEARPTICIADFPLRWTVEGMGELYDKGVHLQSSIIQPPLPNTIPATVKHRSRLYFALAEHPWSILYDQDGYICEGNGFNIMAIYNGTMVTPNRNCLHGISADYVMGFAPRNVITGKAAEATQITREALLHCDEVFIAATPFCILPVTKVDQWIIGTGKPGPIYKKILSLWSSSVGVDIAKQVQKWDGTIFADEEPANVATRSVAN